MVNVRSDLHTNDQSGRMVPYRCARLLVKDKEVRHQSIERKRRDKFLTLSTLKKSHYDYVIKMFERIFLFLLTVTVCLFFSSFKVACYCTDDVNEEETCRQTLVS